MNEILRDREHASIRLVMNPDRMVIKEAQRTFTYLNLYGYLTDAVIVNRVFPDEVAGGYFGDWRERQRERLERGPRGLRPGPGAHRPLLRGGGDRRRGCSTGSAPSCSSAGVDPAAVLHTELAHEIESVNGTATLRIRVPFGERGEIGLKKVGAELIVSVGPRKRTIILPAALARRRPTGAKLERRRARGELQELPRATMATPEQPHQCVELCPICRGAEVLRATVDARSCAASGRRSSARRW